MQFLRDCDEMPKMAQFKHQQLALQNCAEIADPNQTSAPQG
jgi:hypothetical protein